jgi:hypothetical protein
MYECHPLLSPIIFTLTHSHTHTHIQDEALLEYWYGVDVDGEAEGEGAASPWVIRIELDKDKVAAKRVQLEDLQAIIVDVFGAETFQIIVSDQNMPMQVLRLRFVPDDDEDVDIDFLKSVEEQIRTKLKVSGYDKILKVGVCMCVCLCVWGWVYIYVLYVDT